MTLPLNPVSSRSINQGNCERECVATKRNQRKIAEETKPVRSMDTLYLVHKLTNRLRTPFSAYLERQHSISFNEFRMLMSIGQQSGKASHELAALTGVTPMSVSRAVSTLEKHGRIRVTRDESNGRRKTLHLTADGERLYVAMQKASDLVAGYLLSDLKSAEIIAFNQTLERLIDTLERTDSEGKSLFLEATRPEQ